MKLSYNINPIRLFEKENDSFIEQNNYFQTIKLLLQKDNTYKGARTQ